MEKFAIHSLEDQFFLWIYLSVFCPHLNLFFLLGKDKLLSFLLGKDNKKKKAGVQLFKFFFLEIISLC